MDGKGGGWGSELIATGLLPTKLSIGPLFIFHSWLLFSPSAYKGTNLIMK